MTQFVRFQLRTTDVPAARTFYATLLGEGVAEIEPLPEQARAQGAPAHWLGHLNVENVEQATQAFAGHGATPIGPVRQTSDGGRFAILRDPGKAVIAVTTQSAIAKGPQPEVLWHHLYATNIGSTADAYRAMFGWQLLGRRDLGQCGVHQEFSWRKAEHPVGSVVDVAQLTGIHSHWLFYFRIAALEPALTFISAAGGLVAAHAELPNGRRAAVCEDPQRGAFAICEAPSRGAM